MNANDFVLPLDSAVPGEYFFHLGVKAVNANDYRHAVTMYKVAASWAYKAAEYNPGVIFVKGEGGVPKDRVQGLAWLTLAAEREQKDYTVFRHQIRSVLSADELAKADSLVSDLSGTYGDKHALPRAKARWREVRNSATGSHVGFIGNLKIGQYGAGTPGERIHYTAAEAIGTASLEGSTAYRELRATDDPYDPRFDVGTVPVGEVTEDAKEGPREPPSDKP